MTELKALSKLKMAGKLHYWRGTIEIDEYELHAICDEIQAEYDKAVAAINSAAGNWAKADAVLRRACEFIADYGSCPYDTFDLYEPWEESCYQKCSADVDRAECWRRYFERRGDAE